MLIALRFTFILVMVLWLGTITTMAFHVAPSLFGNESGLTPTGAAAGDIIAPLLGRMHVTGWIAGPVACALLIAILMLCRLSSKRAVIVALVLLALAWGIDLVSGTVVTDRIHGLRKELRAEFGEVEAAPKDDPRRRSFGALHGVSMMLSMVNLILGTGAIFAVTQMTEPARRTEGS